ncbi:MFS transporter [Cryptosporangium aurantiacum]|uniref:Predicted arabinose efflux permease, MFS family n=1 Tax=Cryptosporangium aurantiacum TaxID=134849 RepID=A0A1M7JCP6_9ACTN|nr:MFS transporter [Cryptosporangium aurantiacum]SHM50756.1 Predicted arabinose efflux permease, MFS family [Cryptosporangium aurantiacum]
MNAALAPLRHAAYRRLLTGRTITTLGNAVAPIALAFAVLDLTGSVSMLGLIVGARSLANVAFLLLGGVLADRLPRPVVLVGSNVLSGLTQAVVAVLVLTHAAHVPTLIVLSALNGALSALSLPATAALTPQTVPSEILQQANAVMRIGSNTALILGAAAGGALVAVVGPGWGLAIDAATFLLAGAVFVGLRVPRVANETGNGIVTDLREGWGEFTARTWVWVVVVAFTVINATIGAMQVLGPAVADKTIGRSGWGLVLAAETAGFVLGGLIALRTRYRRPLLAAMLWMALEPLFLVGLGVAPNLLVLIPLGVLVGIGVEQFSVAWETTMQQHIPPERLARVYSYDMLGSYLAIPIGEVVAGPVAGSVGMTATLLGAAALSLTAALAAAATPSVRRLRRQDPSPAVAEPLPL